MNNGYLKLALIIAFVCFLVIISPILTIWALNTLFPALSIPTTFDTWLAALIVNGMLYSRASK